MMQRGRKKRTERSVGGESNCQRRGGGSMGNATVDDDKDKGPEEEE